MKIKAPMNDCPKCRSFEIKINTSYKYFDIYECNICGYWTFSKIEDCCRNPFIIIAIDRKTDKKYALYKQCIYCGGSVNRTKPLDIKIYKNDICSEFNTSSFDQWKSEREREYEIISLSKRNFDYFHSPKYKYYLYLISPEWKDKRTEVLKRDNNMCQKCLVNIADDIHHLTYKNLGNETINELISVCRTCHEEIHRNK